MNARILAPIDGSSCSHRALEYAIDFSKTLGAALHVVHVVDTARAVSLTFGEPQLIAGTLQALRDEGKSLLEDAARAAREKGVRAETTLVSGSPAEEIERLAADAGATMIVIGSHGRTGITRAFMGSVAEDVVRRSPVPVLVVPMSMAAAAA